MLRVYFYKEQTMPEVAYGKVDLPVKLILNLLYSIKRYIICFCCVHFNLRFFFQIFYIFFRKRNYSSFMYKEQVQ